MEHKKPSFKFALTTFLVIMAVLALGMLFFKYDTHSLLLISVIIAASAAIYLGYKFDEVVQFMVDGLSRAMGALFIFIMIGALVATWIAAGTVPALVVYGLKLLNPVIFLPIGLILCSIMSVACGTSWGTVGTLGVALMGIGTSMGISPAIVAGTVVSGAYFGDKMSPMSDTTNLAAASAETDVYAHIRAMSKSTIPAYVICLIAYAVLGFRYAGASANEEGAMIIIEKLNELFTINPIVLIPVAFTLVLSFMKKPALVALMSGIVSAIVIAVLMQGVSVADSFSILNYGYSFDSGVDTVNTLINRGGVQNMMWTFSFAFIILAMGGILEGIGILRAIVEKIAALAKGPTSLMISTILFADAACFATGDSYPAIVLTGTVFRPAFDEAGLHRSMLSRATEEGASLMIPLVPWSGTAAFIGGALGVTALEYAPFAFLNIINPIVSIVLVAMGGTIIWKSGEVSKRRKKAS